MIVWRLICVWRSKSMKVTWYISKDCCAKTIYAEMADMHYTKFNCSDPDMICYTTTKMDWYTVSWHSTYLRLKTAEHLVKEPVELNCIQTAMLLCENRVLKRYIIVHYLNWEGCVRWKYCLFVDTVLLLRLRHAFQTMSDKHLKRRSSPSHL